MGLAKAQIKHPKEYVAWVNMKVRCYGTNPEHQNYRDNNITVCDAWLKDFYKFLADVGPAPTPEHSLDRKDNLKGYYKDNIRWANAIQQANNRHIPDISHKLRNPNGTFK